MDNFQIQTAQNIQIEQRVAGIGDRLLAFLVDTLIIAAYWIAAFLVLAGFGLDSNSIGSIWVFWLVMGIPPFLYYLLFESFWDGRTPGKAAIQLRVVKLDGSKPGFGSYFVRWIMRIIDISLSSGGIAVFTILLNGKGQRLGDMAASTTVINEKKRVRLSNTILVDIPEDYVPKYPQVTVFSDTELRKIKSIYSKARHNGNHNVMIKLADKSAKMMQVTPEEKPLIFLDRIIKDYNYYTQQ
ncbi:MAG: RDD family protein [Leeuwenhoekiella sp.]